MPVDVPLTVPVCSTGDFVVKCSGWKLADNKEGKAKTQNIQFNFVVLSSKDGNTDIPDKGKFLSDTAWDTSSMNAKVRIKQIAVAAGLVDPSYWASGQLNLDDIKEKTLLVSVVQRPYQDTQTGEQKLAANISKYHIDPSVKSALGLK